MVLFLDPLTLEHSVIEKSNDASGGDSGEVELHFVFSCLSNWREGSKDLRTERKKSTALQYVNIFSC